MKAQTFGRWTAGAAALAMLFITAAPTSAAQLVVNGSFEDNSPIFDGWTHTGGAGDFTPAAPSGATSSQPASDGTRIMVWNGGNQPPNGILSQSFNTVLGVNYTLSFDYQKLAGGTGSFSLQYKIVDNITTSNVLSPATVSDTTGSTGGWNIFSGNFVGTGNSVTLTFTDQSSNSGSSFDGGLDNVQVNGVEPTIGLSSALAPGNIIIGGTAALGATISELTPSTSANYSIAGVYTGGSGALGTITNGSGSVTHGTPKNFSATATPTALGLNTVQFTATSNNSANSPQTIDSSVTVLDHSDAEFESPSATNTLNLDFGTLDFGSGTHSMSYRIQNLTAAFRAGLDLDTITETSDPDGVFSTNAATFSNLANGGFSSFFDVLVETNLMGMHTAQYTFVLSDQNGLSGSIGGQTLTLNVSALIVPEPDALPLWLALLGLIVVWHRRRGANFATVEVVPLAVKATRMKQRTGETSIDA
jgi:hypothetical protein